MNQDILQEVFIEHIRDLYDAEKQLLKAIPKLAKAAASEELSEALLAHLEETKSQVSRLEEVFKLLGEPAKGKPCKGMKGLVEEGDEAAQEDEGVLRDIAIVAGAQKVEHYEISGYGTACALAEQLGMDDAVQLLRETEEEEINADAKLTGVAMILYDSFEGDDAEEQVPARQGTKSAGRGATPAPRSRKAG